MCRFGLLSDAGAGDLLIEYTLNLEVHAIVYPKLGTMDHALFVPRIEHNVCVIAFQRDRGLLAHPHPPHSTPARSGCILKYGPLSV